MNAQEINQAKDQVTAKQQALNGQENLRTAQTNAKQHLNGLSDLTDAQKDAVKRQIEGATHVNEVTQAQNNADALNTAMTNLKMVFKIRIRLSKVLTSLMPTKRNVMHIQMQ